MSKSFQQFKNDAFSWFSKNSPTILTGTGVATMILAVVQGIAATPKAMRSIQRMKDELRVDKLTPLQTVKASWKYYIPTAVTMVASGASIIGASTIHTRRNAALLTAYTVAETTLRSYGEKVIETIGEQRESNLRDRVEEEVRKEIPVKEEKQIILTGDGDYLCFDQFSGRYFRSNIEKIRRVENALNKRLMSEMTVALNELYCEIGLQPIQAGHDLGWNVDKGLIDIRFTAVKATEYNDEPCLCISFEVDPMYDFRNLP